MITTLYFVTPAAEILRLTARETPRQFEIGPKHTAGVTGYCTRLRKGGDGLPVRPEGGSWLGVGRSAAEAIERARAYVAARIAEHESKAAAARRLMAAVEGLS